MNFMRYTFLFVIVFAVLFPATAAHAAGKSPDLSISEVQANVTPWTAGVQNISVKVKLANNGSAAAKSIGLTTVYLENYPIGLNLAMYATLKAGDTIQIGKSINGVYQSGTYTLKVCLNEKKSVKESDYTNNCSSTEIVIPPAPLADLSVDSASMFKISDMNYGKNSEIKLVVTVRNDGPADVVQLPKLGVESDVFPKVFFFEPKGSLGLIAGASITQIYTFKIPHVDAGSYPTKICINAWGGKNYVAESSIENNCLELSLFVSPPPQPDLVLVDPVVTAVNSANGGQTTIKIVTELANQGAADVTKVPASNIFIESLGKNLTFVTQKPMALVAGKKIKLVNYFEIPAIEAGMYQATVCANQSSVSKKIIDEGNVENNCVDVEFEVLGAPDPDFSIPFFEVTVKPTALGFKFTTANIGAGDAKQNPDVAIYFDGANEAETIVVPKFKLLTADKQSAVVFVVPNTALTEPGTHTIKVCLNPNEIIKETNFENNCAETEIEIPEPIAEPQPDIAWSSISTTLTKSTITGGNFLRVSAKFRNVGDASVPNIKFDAVGYFDESDELSLFRAHDSGGEKKDGVVNFNLSGDVPTNFTAGEHSIKVCVNEQKVFTEKSYENNCVTGKFVVPSALFLPLVK